MSTQKQPGIDRDEIARMAGVSAATVSRVFNKPSLVSEHKRTAVLDAAKKAGYRPNKAASSLRRRRTGEICFVERAFGPNYFWGSPRMYPWYYAEALRAVSEVLQDTPHTLSIVRIHEPADIARLADDRKPDALVFFDAAQDEIVGAIAGLQALGLPAIAGHHVEHFAGIHRAMTDNRAGGVLAGRKLRESGYDKAVYVASEIPSSYVHSERWEGFRSAFDAGSVKLLVCETGKDGGFKAGHALVEDIRKKRVDCIGVVNDYTAVGVIMALYKAGLRIPEDVGMIAYDNLPFTEALPFKLASVDLRIGDIYKEAAQALRRLIEKGSAAAPVERLSIRVEPVFVEGESI